jgi:hypothetical protein
MLFAGVSNVFFGDFSQVIEYILELLILLHKGCHNNTQWGKLLSRTY